MACMPLLISCFKKWFCRALKDFSFSTWNQWNALFFLKTEKNFFIIIILYNYVRIINDKLICTDNYPIWRFKIMVEKFRHFGSCNFRGIFISRPFTVIPLDLQPLTLLLVSKLSQGFVIVSGIFFMRGSSGPIICFSALWRARSLSSCALSLIKPSTALRLVVTVRVSPLPESSSSELLAKSSFFPLKLIAFCLNWTLWKEIIFFDFYYLSFRDNLFLPLHWKILL